MHVLFDFVPDRNNGVAIFWRGFYRARQGNYMIPTGTVDNILAKAGIPTDFKSGELAFRSKVHTDGCVVTCPPVVGCRLTPIAQEWRNNMIATDSFDPLVQLIQDNAPLDVGAPTSSAMWELNVLGGTFEVDTPISISKEYRRCQIHASYVRPDKAGFVFTPDQKVTGTRLLVPTPVPLWFRRLAEYSGAYPTLPFTWINHIRAL